MNHHVRFSYRVPISAFALLAAFAVPLTSQAADELAAPTTSSASWLASQPRDGFDVAALAATLTTPAAAFAYVRDEIAYEPYSGVMKGAAGALLTHGANDFDRALLLAKLLEAQGLPVKLVRGTLPGSASQALVDQVTKRPSAVERMLASLPTTEPIQEKTAFDAKAQRQFFDQRSADRSRMIADAEAAQRTLVSAAVPTSGPKSFGAPKEHVWVQATIDEKIVNFDPSTAAAKVGDAPAKSTDEWAADGLPDEVFQTLKISLISETLKEGQLTRNELLMRDLVAATALNQGLRLAVVQAPTDQGPGSYFPLLLVGADETDGTVFKLSGSLPKPKDSGMVGMLGGFGGGAPAPAEPALDNAHAPKLARLWVEVTFHSPGLPDDVARRVMLDRVEPQGETWKLVDALADDEAVRGLLVQAWDAALDVGAPHPIAIMEIESGALAALKPATQALGEKRALSASDLPALPPAFQLWNFFLTSGLKHQALSAAEPKTARSIHVRPRLAFIRHGFTLADWTKPAQKKLRYEEGIDLVNAPFAFLGDVAAAKSLAVRAGLTDTAFEQYAINATSSFNTVPFMAAAQTQKIALLTITDAKQVDSLKIPPAIRAVLAGEVADGRVLLMPARPVELKGTHVVGWWSIDPTTGYAIGKMELGGAQAMVEKGQTEEKVSEWTQTYVKIMGDALKCFEGEVTKAFKQDVRAAIMGGDAAQTPGADTMAACLRDAACDALKDMASGRLSNVVAERESKMLKDLLFNWLRSQAVDQAAAAENAGCQALLGGS